MSGKHTFDYGHLTPAERLELADELWNSVDPGEVDWTLTDAQKAELERRLEAHRLDPDGGETWDVVKAEILRDLAHGAGAAPLPLADAEMNELDRRLEELDRDPDGGRDWEDVRDELLQRAARRRDSAG